MPLWRRETSTESATRARERAVRERLAGAGLRGKRRRDRDLAASLDEEPARVRLRAALEALGPLFAAFGYYLSTRPDLLPLQDCLELAKTNQSSPHTPTEWIRNSIRAEGGGVLEELASRIEDPPLLHGPVFQWHEASLPGGDRVRVKVLRPEFEKKATEDIGLLPLLKEIELIGGDGKAVDLSLAVEGFTDTLQRQMDLGNEANILTELAGELEEDDDLAVPKLYPEHCSPKVLTTEPSAGKSIDEIVSPSDIEGDAEDPTSDSRPNAELARCLCLAWLRQSLLEGLCWEGSIEENLRVLSGNRFVVAGGQFTRLDTDTRASLLDYMTAVTREDPERACNLLLRETQVDFTVKSRDRLCQQFRQGEPFRLGSWSDAYAGKRLADTLFVQWRLAHQAGFRAPATLTAFYRGLLETELLARRLARYRDPLNEGLEDLRVISATVRLRELLGPSRLKANLERFLPAMEELLQKVGEAGLSIQDGRQRKSDEPEASSVSPISWTFIGGVLALLVALAVISNRLVSAQPGGRWVEGVAALGFVALATILLKKIHRGQKG